MQEEILLQEAKHEIQVLRASNHTLQTRLGMFDDIMSLVRGLKPDYENKGMCRGYDIVDRISDYLVKPVEQDLNEVERNPTSGVKNCN